MKRRTFLETSGAFGLGASIVPEQFFKIQEKKIKEVINIGIIGTGDRGSGLINIFRQFPQFKIIALCDVLPFRLDSASQKLNEKVSKYKDYEKLLNNKNIDAVIIATPLSMHYEMAVAALEAGKHVYCEKTMTYQTDEALDLVQKVKSNRLIFQVGHQYRYLPLYDKVSEYINDSYLGQITNIYIQWNRNGDWRRPVLEKKYERLINWRMYREFSGGLTAELHSHQIDFVNQVFKSHPIKAMGMGGIDYWKDGRETFDNVNTLLEYPNGMKVNCVSLTANAHEGYLFKFKGSKGTIELGINTGKFYYEKLNSKEIGTVDGVSGATKIKMEKGEGIEINWNNGNNWEGTHYALTDFYDSIIQNRTPESDVFSGAKTAISVRMAIDALRTGNIQYWQDKYSQILKE